MHYAVSAAVSIYIIKIWQLFLIIPVMILRQGADGLFHNKNSQSTIISDSLQKHPYVSAQSICIEDMPT